MAFTESSFGSCSQVADCGNLCFCKRPLITDLFQLKKVVRLFSTWGFLRDRNMLCLDDSTPKI